MPGKRSKKSIAEKRARALAMARLYLIAAAILVIAVLVLGELATTGGWSSLWARLAGPRDLTARAEELNDAIDARLVSIGVENVTGSVADRSRDGRIWRNWTKSGVIPYGMGTFYCNALITEAARSTGGEVIRVTESGPDWRGSLKIDMRLGVGGVETHHLALRESHEPTGAGGSVLDGDRPRVAIVIDDFGYSRSSVVEGFLSMEFPLTVSVLPGTPYCEALAGEASSAGLEVLVHLPMEPARYPEIDPGEGALLLDQTHWEIRQLTNAALEQVPGAVGVNNHMGSAFCRDRARMSTVVAAVSSHGMFYLDSMTTPESSGFDVARSSGVPTARNNMFIDSPLDEEGRVDVLSQLSALEEIARRRGFGVGIGHPHPETLSALQEEVPRMQERGIEFVFVSELTR